VLVSGALRDSETDAALHGWLGKLAFRLGKVLSADGLRSLIADQSQRCALLRGRKAVRGADRQVVPNGDRRRIGSCPDRCGGSARRVRWELR